MLWSSLSFSLQRGVISGILERACNFFLNWCLFCFKRLFDFLKLKYLSILRFCYGPFSLYVLSFVFFKSSSDLYGCFVSQCFIELLEWMIIIPLC